MADAPSTPDIPVFKISQPERYQRVGYRPNKGDTSTPAITISGKWLQEAGFCTGQSLKLRVMPGCIVSPCRIFGNSGTVWKD
ncbi:SymE family type I addiction module toxin [Brenneria goodwinii]|uniref:SymE family type I addiction module toxin n=1 Tax=Brenneria goodwinii TaxID=1109412 RepID=UPI0036F21FC0